MILSSSLSESRIVHLFHSSSPVRICTYYLGLVCHHIRLMDAFNILAAICELQFEKKKPNKQTNNTGEWIGCRSNKKMICNCHAAYVKWLQRKIEREKEGAFWCRDYSFHPCWSTSLNTFKFTFHLCPRAIVDVSFWLVTILMKRPKTRFLNKTITMRIFFSGYKMNSLPNELQPLPALVPFEFDSSYGN